MNLTLSQLQKLEVLRQNKRELEVQLEMYQAVYDKPSFKDQIAETEKEISRLKILVNNAVLYVGKKNELIFKDLNMNRVEILLYEMVKSRILLNLPINQITGFDKLYPRMSFQRKKRRAKGTGELRIWRYKQFDSQLL